MSILDELDDGDAGSGPQPKADKSILDELDEPGQGEADEGDGPDAELGEEFAKAFEAKDYKGVCEAVRKIASTG